MEKRKASLLSKSHAYALPPLTAIDRFLWGSSRSHFSWQQSDQCKERSAFANGFPCFSPSIGYSRPTIPKATVDVEGLSLDADTMNCLEEMNSDLCLSLKQAKVPVEDNKPLAKKAKKGYSSTLIKGQWTEEEDRKLLKLVRQYGVRKWAQIAEKLDGRAGKQCRERWHNHLRPDIKKDGWSEEEEKILVESHEQFGNKWAEIAKRIPGRTENSIKNHWNATKRRQNSRRKNKQSAKASGKKPQSSVLQDYIRNKTLCNTVTTTSPTISTTISTTPDDDYAEDDPSSVIANPCDEELLFMQNLFAGNYVHSTCNSIVNAAAQCGFSSVSNTEVPSAPREDQLLRVEETPQNYSDLYLSYLLNGTVPSPSDSSFSSIDLDDDLILNFGAEQASLGGKKDMDLTEMVSSFSGTSG